MLMLMLMLMRCVDSERLEGLPVATCFVNGPVGVGVCCFWRWCWVFRVLPGVMFWFWLALACKLLMYSLS